MLTMIIYAPCCAQMMTNLHLAPFPRPVSSLIADYPLQQGDHGWQVRT